MKIVLVSRRLTCLTFPTIHLAKRIIVVLLLWSTNFSYSVMPTICSWRFCYRYQSEECTIITFYCSVVLQIKDKPELQ